MCLAALSGPFDFPRMATAGFAAMGMLNSQTIHVLWSDGGHKGAQTPRILSKRDNRMCSLRHLSLEAYIDPSLIPKGELRIIATVGNCHYGPPSEEMSFGGCHLLSQQGAFEKGQMC